MGGAPDEQFLVTATATWKYIYEMW